MTPKLALLEEYALIARALGAPHRLMLLEQLAQGERGVEALALKVQATIANTSQHLQMLRRAGLVTSRREGKSVIYRLTDDKTLLVLDLIRQIGAQNLAVVDEILAGLHDGVDTPRPMSRSELAERIAEGSVTVLDVRPEDEYLMGHIPGAINVLPSGLDGFIAQVSQADEIVAYCRGPFCIYAHQAVAHLRKFGLNARRLDGGLPEWRADRRRVETTAG